MSKREKDIPLPSIDELFARQDVTRVGRDSRDLGDLPRIGWREMINKYLPEVDKILGPVRVPSSEEAERQKAVTNAMLSRNLTREEATRFVERGSDLGGLPALEPSLLEKVIPEEIRQYFRPSATTKESIAAKTGSVAKMVLHLSGVDEPLSVMDPTPLFGAASSISWFTKDGIYSKISKAIKNAEKYGIADTGSKWAEHLKSVLPVEEATVFEETSQFFKLLNSDLSGSSMEAKYVKTLFEPWEKQIVSNPAISVQAPATIKAAEVLSPKEVDDFLSSLKPQTIGTPLGWQATILNKLPEEMAKPIVEKLKALPNQHASMLETEDIYDLFEDVYPWVNKTEKTKEVFSVLQGENLLKRQNQTLWIGKGDYAVERFGGRVYKVSHKGEVIGEAESFAAADDLITAHKNQTLGYEKIGPQEGSNPGGWYSHGGEEVYVKFYNDPTKAFGESLSNTIYNSYGVGASDIIAPVSFLDMVDNKLAHVARKFEGGRLIKSIDELTPKQARNFLKNSPLDILLANWDVISYNVDNILVKGNDVFRIDQGGSLLHRAMDISGRKERRLLDEITEFDRFPVTSTYKQMLEKAGYKDFYDLTPEFFSSVASFPTSWRETVEKLNFSRNLPTEDIEDIIRILNRRTTLLQNKINEMPPVYFGRLTSHLPDNMPEWHKILSANLDTKERVFFLSNYKYELVRKYPEFEDLSGLLSDWFASSKAIKGTMSDLLQFQIQKYGQGSKSGRIAGARTLIQSIARSPGTDTVIRRGKSISHEEFEALSKLRRGDTYHVLPSSFSTKTRVAEGFAYGPKKLMIEIEPGAKSLNAENISWHNEFEHISGGAYEVIGKKQRGDFYVLRLRQTGVFNVK